MCNDITFPRKFKLHTMTYKQSGCRIGQVKRKKVKFSTADKAVSKAFLTRRKDTKRPGMDKTDLPVDLSQSNIKGCGKASNSSESLSSISCECHQSLDRIRCTASPQLEQEGKENLRMTSWETYGCDLTEKRDMEELMDNGNTGDMFPDDDSNQIFPVEQFFGNMDIVQECPQRSEEMSLWGHRVHKRRHYYAREDSDEEEEPRNTACSS